MPKKRFVKKYAFKRGKENNSCCKMPSCGCGGGIYFFGMIGAAVYYLQQATGFWQGVLGILKAIVWPAFLVYKLFAGF